MDYKIKNKSSSEWRRIESYCKAQIAEMRKDNDGDLNDLETSKLRGKIEFAKQVLDLGEAEYVPEVVTQTYID